MARLLRLRQCIAVLGLLSAVLLGGTIIISAVNGVFLPFTWTADYSQPHYGIVIDAGSHGTRGHLFRWTGRVEDPMHPLSSPLTIPEEIFTYDSGLPGVSDLVDTPKRVGPLVLQPLVTALLDEMMAIGATQGDIQDTLVFVKATAGMRNLGDDQRDLLMSNIREFLLDPGRSPFKFEPLWARVISGEEEGVYGWIAVNNFTNTLLGQAESTFGAIELGGASAQITFEPVHASILEALYSLKLGDRMIRLYSHSFLGYGWGDAQLRLTTKLAIEALFSILASNGRLTNTPNPNIVQEVLRGDVNGILVVNQTGKAVGKDVDPNLLTEKSADVVGVLQAEHPCFPKGYVTTFDMPSLIFPDGRFFLDVDVRSILVYLDSIGLDLNNPLIQQTFPTDLLNSVKANPLKSNGHHNIVRSSARSFANVEEISEAPRMEDAIAASVEEDEGQTASPFVPFSTPLPAPPLMYRVIFTGSGNYFQCNERAQELFYPEPCFLHTCSFNGVYQPRIAQSRFLALGQYAKIREAFGVPAQASPDTLSLEISRVCQMSWEGLLRIREEGHYQNYGKKGIAHLCWKAVWAYATLTQGYGFAGDSHAITFYDSASESGPPAWALGAMVEEISYLPWQNPRGRYLLPFIWALITSVFLAILAVAQEVKYVALREKYQFLTSVASRFPDHQENQHDYESL